MSKEVCRDKDEGDRPSSPSKVMDALTSRHSCIHEPLPAAASPNDRRYLTSLRVFGNREVDEPQSPLPTSFSRLMADQNIIDPQMIKEKITAALKLLSFREARVLVQFWSPVAVGKRCLLTTLDQPFGVGVVDEGLYSYRLDSEQRVFVVDGEYKEKEIGPPARVYRRKLPEWSFDVQGLSTRQYVQDWTGCYNIHGYLNLPVFEPTSGCCVGVLELITSSKYVDYAFEVQQVSRALKEENLKSPNVFEDPRFSVGDKRRQHELDEIVKVLKTVCEILKLPLAQTWGLSGYTSFMSNSGNIEKMCSSFNKRCIGKVCMSTAALPFYVGDLSKWEFHEACQETHLEKSRGVVGRSLSSRCSCFCKDVTKLAEDEYPLVHMARMNGITSCLAMYLKGLEVDDEYVMELFLPPRSTNETDLQSLVETVKQQIKNASGVELGDTSSPQVIGGAPFNWNPESENLQLIAENEQNDDVTVVLKKPTEAAYLEHMEEDNLENEPSTGGKDSDILNEPIRRRRKRSDNRSISLEEIKKHYGKTVDEAAASLHVSRSTLKRICRSFGIPRWPHIKGRNETEPLLKSNQTDVSEGALTLVSRAWDEPLAATHSTHDPETITRGKFIENMEAAKKVENVVIKARYGEEIVKFPFRVSDGLVRLEEEVATRFQLRVGSFSLKYVDEDGDMILIACDNDLMGSLGGFREPDVNTMIRVLVQLVAHQSPVA